MNCDYPTVLRTETLGTLYPSSGKVLTLSFSDKEDACSHATSPPVYVCCVIYPASYLCGFSILFLSLIVPKGGIVRPPWRVANWMLYPTCLLRIPSSITKDRNSKFDCTARFFPNIKIPFHSPQAIWPLLQGAETGNYLPPSEHLKHSWTQ